MKWGNIVKVRRVVGIKLIKIGGEVNNHNNNNKQGIKANQIHLRNFIANLVKLSL